MTPAEDFLYTVAIVLGFIALLLAIAHLIRLLIASVHADHSAWTLADIYFHDRDLHTEDRDTMRELRHG